MNNISNIIKSFCVIVVAVIIPLPGHSENISQKQASKIAEAFFNEAYGQYVAAPKFVWNGRQLTTDRLFSPFYVYNHPRGGFVIISADSKAFPVLGYSLTSGFEKDKLTEEEKELLKQYAHEIELIRYDSRIPERAVAAWQNLPLTINRAIHNPYDTPEFEALDEDSREIIEAIDRRNNSIMMPTAVEFPIYDASLYRDYTLDDVLEPAEEIPFSFYNSFIEEIKGEENARLAKIEEILSPTDPMIEMLGGAHFVITFPVEVIKTSIYSLQGTRMQEKYYKDTNVINLDLSSLPSGFYVMMALGDDGRVYGFKLFR